MAIAPPPLISNKRGRDSGNNQANTSEESDKRLKPGTSEEPDTSKEPDKRLSRRVDGCVKTMEGSLKEIGDFTRDRTSNQIVAVAYRELLLSLLIKVKAAELPESEQTCIMLHVLQHAQRKFRQAALRYEYAKDFQKHVFGTILHATENENSVFHMVTHLDLCGAFIETMKKVIYSNPDLPTSMWG